MSEATQSETGVGYRTVSNPHDTIELERGDLARLITRPSLFWDGCPCAECEGVITRIGRVWPDLAADLRKLRSS